VAFLVGLKLRGPDRDRQTDARRFAELQTSFDHVSAAIEAERSGLHRRYEAATVDAAFLAEAMENDEAGGGSSSRMDGLAATISGYHRRVEELRRQQALVDELRVVVANFTEPKPQAVDDASAGQAGPGRDGQFGPGNSR